MRPITPQGISWIALVALIVVGVWAFYNPTGFVPLICGTSQHMRW